VSGLFSLETISFVVEKLFTFMSSHLSILSLSCWAIGFFWGSPRLYLLIPKYSLLFPVLTSEFRVWKLRSEFKALELILVQDDKHGLFSFL
jgi:hypothetical protein